MAELVIMVGLQGAGKSTFVNKWFSQTHSLVSKDKMSRRAGKEARQVKAIEDLLGAGKNVVVDNCNVLPSERAAIIAIGKRYGAAIVGYYFDDPLDACLERNAKREGSAKIEPWAIIKKSKLLQPPTVSEGFELLFRVRIADGRFVLNRIRPDVVTESYSRQEGQEVG